MPSVIINDVEMEARVGERLLSVARRNAAHIGFVCDGNGVCQTCQLRVIAGAEHLSPPNEAERAWMPAHRLDDGHRLACQTALRGGGPVVALTNAEELRRQAAHALRRSDHEDLRDRMRPLLENLARMSADQVVRYPWNIIAALARVGVGRFIYPLRDAERWADDAARITRRMAGAGERPEAGPSLDAVARAAQRLGPAAPPVPPTPPSAQTLAEARILEAARDLRRARAEASRARR